MFSKHLVCVFRPQLLTFKGGSFKPLEPPLLRAWKPLFDTETALFKVKNDILMSVNQQHAALLVLLDLSPAFDTIHDHKLIQCLESDCTVTGNAFAWFGSYVCGSVPASVCQWWTFQEVLPVPRRPSKILLRPAALHHIYEKAI